MLSRRRWLQIAGASSVASTPLAAAGPALQSRKAEATPITVPERMQRLERARALMSEQKMDALVLTGGTSLAYFTGMHWGNSERLFAFVVPQRADPFLVCPAFEEERANEQVRSGLGDQKVSVLTWQEDDSSYQLIAAGLKDRKLSSGKLAIEERVPWVFSDGIAQANPHFTLASGTPITAGCRMVKSSHELDLMRLASSVTLQAYEWAWRQLREGMTQHEFSGLISAAYDQLGFPGEASVQVGKYSALPHGSVQPQIIREGQIILIDDGCTVDGYQSDISRSFVLGKPSGKMREVFDIVHRAQAVALETAKPSRPCEAVDAAARQVIADAGFGPGYRFFTHRVGHGMGMDGHEWPYLVKGNKLPLAPGMVFSDEPGIYIPGEFGIRLEDDMYLTENGAQLFTPQSPSLEQPFAT